MTDMWDEANRALAREYDPGPLPDDGPSGEELLDDLRVVLDLYVVMPSPETADAVVLWIAATHAQPAWEHATRLALLSPEKRCGKSRCLDVIEATCHAPLITVNISPAALVRSIGEEDPPTLLLDEADTVFGGKAADNHEDLRGIVNAGHERLRPYIRWDITTRSTEYCPTFSMVALAGIGNLPDTIMDRAVVVRMRRRAPGESVRPYRTRRDRPWLREVGIRLADWIRGHAGELRDAVPDMPVEDRDADNWESLIAVADLAGGHWPERARLACKVLAGETAADDEGTLGVRLLADLADVWGDAAALSTEVILARLRGLTESPWDNLRGHPLDARGLAWRLKPYGVKSRPIRVGDSVPRGYRREDLHDAWARYVRTPGATDATSATSQVSPVADDSGVALQPEDRPECSATGKTSATALTCDVADVADVSDDPRTEELPFGEEDPPW